MHPLQNGRFIISLDFELLWGVRDKRTIESYGANIRGVRQVIPALLELFDRYGIHASFATVGFLFARNKKELQAFIPSMLPGYPLKKYSPYENGYMNTIGPGEVEDIYHYGASLIGMIKEHPAQEICSHTFSHFYCLENASLEAFEADLMAAKRIAAAQDVELKTIVFPRNQYSEQHIAVCEKLGFTGYRGNESATIYQPRKNEEQHIWIRGLKLADSYINITGHHTFLPQVQKGIINIPASRFLRPYSKKLTLFDPLRLHRIKRSLHYAAQKNEGYQLWWHPHNFGVNLKENLYFLEEILKYYRQLHAAYGLQSRSMKEMAEEMRHDG
jgi:peptidoglycan/xylan/chitin deacetylase (PgdA/CDA1 family)